MSFYPMLLYIAAGIFSFIFNAALITGSGVSTVAGLTPILPRFSSGPPPPVVVRLELMPEMDRFVFWSLIFYFIVLPDGYLPVPRFLVVTRSVYYFNILFKMFRTCYTVIVCMLSRTSISLDIIGQHRSVCCHPTAPTCTRFTFKLLLKPFRLCHTIISCKLSRTSTPLGIMDQLRSVCHHLLGPIHTMVTLTLALFVCWNGT